MNLGLKCEETQFPTDPRPRRKGTHLPVNLAAKPRKTHLTPALSPLPGRRGRSNSRFMVAVPEITFRGDLTPALSPLRGRRGRRDCARGFGVITSASLSSSFEERAGVRSRSWHGTVGRRFRGGGDAFRVGEVNGTETVQGPCHAPASSEAYSWYTHTENARYYAGELSQRDNCYLALGIRRLTAGN